MRISSGPPLLLALLLATPAAAQTPGRPHRYGDPPPAPRDSTHTLAGAWQLWTHGGFGWLSAPSDVRRRYTAGLDVGASGDRRFADRLALRGRLDYDDLPSSKPDAVVINGIAYATNIDYGHGWVMSAMGGGALRAWNHLWLEGEAGTAYFNSGLGSGDTYEDPASGTRVALVGGSGWGAAWTSAARYEFQPGHRDRILGEIRFSTMNRHGTELRFFSIRAGYRAF